MGGRSQKAFADSSLISWTRARVHDCEAVAANARCFQRPQKTQPAPTPRPNDPPAERDGINAISFRTVLLCRPRGRSTAEPWAQSDWANRHPEPSVEFEQKEWEHQNSDDNAIGVFSSRQANAAGSSGATTRKQTPDLPGRGFTSARAYTPQSRNITIVSQLSPPPSQGHTGARLGTGGVVRGVWGRLPRRLRGHQARQIRGCVRRWDTVQAVVVEASFRRRREACKGGVPRIHAFSLDC
jgi:hypothetical protein